jgi:hypothetical protein
VIECFVLHSPSVGRGGAFRYTRPDMFPYDPDLAAAVHRPVATVADVLHVMQMIDATCVDGDGLKWFNWLYLQVTKAVEARIAAGEFADRGWLAALDVHFAQLYFTALDASLSGARCPGCWEVLFTRRNNTRIARIQFALSGINAHINHDLPEALVATDAAGHVGPRHATPQYRDYTALNSTFDGLISLAKQILHVRLLGDALPPISHLEDTIAGWNVCVAREQAWTNTELLWTLREGPQLAAGFMHTLDGLTTVAGKSLLVPVP